MQWLTDVLASVPEDFTVPPQELPEGAKKVAALSPDMTPAVRAWMYTVDQLQKAAKEGLQSSLETLWAMLLEGARELPPELVANKRTVERLERQERALRGLIAAALWTAFPEPRESLGTAFTADGWIIFEAPDNREYSGAGIARLGNLQQT